MKNWYFGGLLINYYGNQLQNSIQTKKKLSILISAAMSPLCVPLEAYSRNSSLHLHFVDGRMFLISRQNYKIRSKCTERDFDLELFSEGWAASQMSFASEWLNPTQTKLNKPFLTLRWGDVQLSVVQRNNSFVEFANKLFIFETKEVKTPCSARDEDCVGHFENKINVQFEIWLN